MDVWYKINIFQVIFKTINPEIEHRQFLNHKPQILNRSLHQNTYYLNLKNFV